MCRPVKWYDFIYGGTDTAALGLKSLKRFMFLPWNRQTATQSAAENVILALGWGSAGDPA